jgi:hypothetical protein
MSEGKTQAIAKIRKESIFCPNCGENGDRHYIEQENLIITECPSCDYLMITSNLGRVIEAYAPGITMNNYQ